MRNEYKKVRYLLYLSIKMKINPISSFASFFVPLRMDSAEAASRHFSKNKALTIISRS